MIPAIELTHYITYLQVAKYKKLKEFIGDSEEAILTVLASISLYAHKGFTWDKLYTIGMMVLHNRNINTNTPLLSKINLSPDLKDKLHKDLSEMRRELQERLLNLDDFNESEKEERFYTATVLEFIENMGVLLFKEHGDEVTE